MYVCMLRKDLDCVIKIGRDAKSLYDKARVKLTEMQKNRKTVLLMNARIIFMTVNASLRTVKLRTGIRAYLTR